MPPPVKGGANEAFRSDRRRLVVFQHGLRRAAISTRQGLRQLLWLDDLDIKSHPYCFFYRDQPIVRQARRKLAEGCGTAVSPRKIWCHAKPRRRCAAIGRFKCSSQTSTRNCEGPIDG